MKKRGLVLFLLLIITFIPILNVYGLSESKVEQSQMIENILLIGLDGINDNIP